MWFVNIAYTLQGCREEWNLSTFDIGMIGAFYVAGLLVGGFLWGYISNKYGRMYGFKNTVLIATISSVCLLFSINYQMVCGSLFLLGLGISGEISLAGTVFMEYCPPTKRYYITLMSLFLGLGANVVASIALLVSIFNNTIIYSWRYIIGFGVICEAVSLFFRYFMKETPAFYAMKGDLKEAEKILNLISWKNNNKEFVFEENQEQSALYEFSGSFFALAQENPDDDSKFSTIYLLKQLCKGKLLRATVILSMVI